MNTIELLAPAGNLEKLKVALAFGADAIYIGGKEYSLRARASNFDIEDIKEAVSLAKDYHAKIYVTCNIIAHNEDLDDQDKFKNYIKALDEAGVIGVIVADLGMISIIKEVAPSLEIHVSTQLSTMNSETVNFLESLGATRVVLARECTLDEIRAIKENSNIELEVFIHGGMCMSVSGKCVLSNYLTNRDANRGGCAHSCRWYYDLYDEQGSLISDNKFTFASKDLETLNYIKALKEIGVASLKIEGRMKSEHYLGTVIGSYRKLLDDIDKNININTKDYQDEIKKASNRPTSSGFFEGRANVEQQIFDRAAEIPTQEFVAKVLSYDKESKIAKIEQRNNFNLEQELEVFGPKLKTTNLVIRELYDEDNNPVEVARHAKQILYFKSDLELNEYDMIRVKK